jgi:hypothetical protein
MDADSAIQWCRPFFPLGAADAWSVISPTAIMAILYGLLVHDGIDPVGEISE